MRFRMAILIGLLATSAVTSRAAEEAPLLAHSPTVSKNHVVFAYGGYLWSVPRDGGDARQLTTGGHEGLPVRSADPASWARGAKPDSCRQLLQSYGLPQVPSCGRYLACVVPYASLPYGSQVSPQGL